MGKVSSLLVARCLGLHKMLNKMSAGFSVFILGGVKRRKCSYHPCGNLSLAVHIPLANCQCPHHGFQRSPHLEFGLAPDLITSWQHSGLKLWFLSGTISDHRRTVQLVCVEERSCLDCGEMSLDLLHPALQIPEQWGRLVHTWLLQPYPFPGASGAGHAGGRK